MSNQRYEFYYALEADGEVEDGKLFCTVAEAEKIESELRAGLPDWVEITVEGGGDYDYTTEESDAASIAASILSTSGFVPEEITG